MKQDYEQYSKGRSQVLNIFLSFLQLIIHRCLKYKRVLYLEILLKSTEAATGVVVQRVKLPLDIPTSPLGVLVQVPDALLLM